MPIHVLIVEDIAMNARLTCAALRDLDIHFTIATTGAEATSAYENGPNFDLILMDLHLPDFDGLTATDAIRESPQYRLRPVPIVAITANALMDDRTAFLKKTGRADYITKPISKEKLLRVVNQHVVMKKKA